MDIIDKNDLTRGPVSGHLFRLTVPMVWGFLSISAFNLVDTFFVSRLGTDPLAALSFTFPVVAMVFAVARGLAVGASSSIARAVGGGEHHKVRRLATDVIVMTVLIVCVIGVAGIATIDPVFRALGAPGRLMPEIRRYMIIWYAGVCVLFIPLLSNHIMRSLGDTYTSSMMLVVAAVLNLALDPLFI
jgi:Na+-driven multidrug efflux pump